MDQVNVQAAKTHLSRLLARVEQGESIQIARGGTPIARIEPVRLAGPRELGFVPYSLPDSFFEPLAEDELLRWEGE